MDFLDPKQRKLHSIRLMIGYSLMTVLIFIATLILVYRAYGFGVDSNGQVIQNGLVYVDSAPSNAGIYIDGKLQDNQTNTRLTLPEGSYNLSVKRDGYRDWNRKIEVVGGGVERISYPMLIQTDLALTEVVPLVADANSVRTQSPDRRWVLVSKTGSIKDFTQIDLRTVSQTTGVPATQDISFPDTIFTLSQNSKLEVIDWSNDNQHFLVKHQYGDQSEYVILNRSEPETSFNINKLLEVNPDKITLRDKKFDQWYLQDKVSGDIIFANAKKEISLYQASVVNYKSYGENIMLFSQKTQDGKLAIYLRQDAEIKLIRKVNDGSVILDIAKYDNNWFTAIASAGDKKTYIYKNPWNFLIKTTASLPAPKSIFHHNGSEVTKLSFSANTRFVFARDANHLSVYDVERDKTYSFVSDKPLDPESDVSWMDGHRLLVRYGGMARYIEFDNANKQDLVPALPGKSTFFDRDYTVLYTVNLSTKNPGNLVLLKTDLRYEQDK